MAADLVRRQVAVIAAISPNAAVAAKSATTTIPIVFQSGSDPVELGLVTSLNRPGGTITGISRLATALVPKLLELLHEAAPNADNIAFLMNPASVNAEAKTREAQAAAHSLGLKQLVILTAGTATEVDSAFTAMTERRANALLIGQDIFFNNQVEQLAALALRNKVPAIYSLREFAAAGGLISYGPDDIGQWRGVATYANRILHGEKPSDLPIQAPTKYQMVINLKAAKAIGLSVSPAFASRADEVIE
jgi:putative ABC transport system substrate-binding protein